LLPIKKNQKVILQDLGLIGFSQAWDLQEKFFQEVIRVKSQNRLLPEDQQLPTPNYLLFCEHSPVFTLGKSGDASHLLKSQEELNLIGIEYFPINRGGDITYHGPGQLTGYPILDLENFFTDIHKYLRLLEQSVIEVCEFYGLVAGRIDGLTGVWIEDRKICALGIRTSRWVSMHGFAFNVNTDLDHFGYIIPCGIQDKEVTSLKKELGREVNMQEVKDLILRRLAVNFDMEIVMAQSQGN
jgi:lipoyl(octanoyl) transferase